MFLLSFNKLIMCNRISILKINVYLEIIGKNKYFLEYNFFKIFKLQAMTKFIFMSLKVFPLFFQFCLLGRY